MDTIVDRAAAAAGSVEGAGVEVAVLVTVTYVVLRWLWLGIRADWAAWRTRRGRRRAVSDEHAEAFDRGMQRLLAEIDARAETGLTAFRRAA